MLHDAIGIDHGMMTTIHSYTGDQPTLDTLHKDLYRARAAALNMIPTSTGAAKAIGLVIPDLKGKLDGISIRVPTPNVSVVDFKFVAKRATTKEEINAAIKAAAEGALKGVLGYTDAPERLDGLQPRSALVDLPHGPDQGDGRQVLLDPLLVRQRMGLLEPHGRYGGGAGEADLVRLQMRPSFRKRGARSGTTGGSSGRAALALWVPSSRFARPGMMWSISETSRS